MLTLNNDASTFDTDPFEPQPDGVDTIFPFWVSKDGTQAGYVELPWNLGNVDSMIRPHDGKRKENERQMAEGEKARR